MTQLDKCILFNRIRVVTSVFPHPQHSEQGRFAANLTDVWKDYANGISVFSPVSLGFRIKRRRRPRRDVSVPGVAVTWISTLGQPVYNKMPGKVRNKLRDHDQNRLISAMVAAQSGEVVYAQFISAGTIARKVSKITGEPYFVGLGESSSLLTGPGHILAERRSALRDARGIICVSPRLCAEAIQLGANPDTVRLIPNTPDPALFHPADRAAARTELGLKPDAFLVLYVGSYSHRKGVLRVDAALKQMRNPALVAYLGSGNLQPDFSGIVFNDSVGHDRLPVWMNAADALVLPTLAEGCCNVIAEALACGLPVVSSDIDDIRWQVPEEGAVLVDPTDPVAIARELDALIECPDRLAGMRTVLRRAATTRGAGRSMQVLQWMAEMLGKVPGVEPGR